MSSAEEAGACDHTRRRAARLPIELWDSAAVKTDHSPEVIEDSDGERAYADIQDDEVLRDFMALNAEVL